ncbi:MAG: hypothetical protein ACYC7D_13465 [Nitrososphaerales archaeon]
MDNQKKKGISNPSLVVLGTGVVILLITLVLTFALGYNPSLPLKDGTSAETITIIQNSTITETMIENFSSVIVSNYTTVSNYTVTHEVTNSSEIGYLQNLISALDKNISSVQSSESYYLSEASSLNSDLAAQSSINSRLQSFLSLQNSTAVADKVHVRQSAYQSTLIGTFSANYAGYVLVNGTSSTSNGYIQFSDSYPGYPSYSSLSFGTGFTTILIPVLPGSVSIYFGNTNFFSSVTANISVFYFS